MLNDRLFCNRCGMASAGDAQFCQACGASLVQQPPESPPALASFVLASPHYGGFWIRVVAWFLDALLVLAAAFPIRLLIGSAVTFFGVGTSVPTQELLRARWWARVAVGIVLGWLYKAGMESSVYQATLGKLAVRLKVTDLEGRRISFVRATARHFAKFLSTFALMLGHLMIAFDEEKQGLHDRIAGTLVVYRR
jgi:uncharacterized RDD family membrane protein YckC